MSADSLACAALLTVAAVVLVAGLAWRVVSYLRTPQPFPIPVTPAPTTAPGVAWRLAREVLAFESLLRASPWTWALGWPFHVALAFALAQHLRYVTGEWHGWVEWTAAQGRIATGVLLVTLAGLWLRRVAVDRVRYISTPADHLMLALIVAIVLTGAAMKYRHPVDIVGVKDFVRGLLGLAWRPLPDGALLRVHLALVAVLMIVFPFSKLLHAPGAVLSPTRYQRAGGTRGRGI